MLLIDATHKCISKVKQDIAEDATVKSVHTLWIYELMKHPEGLTATVLASKSKIDRSLVSREIRALEKGGYITTELTKRRGYNSRIILTEEGKRLAESFSNIAYKIQEAVSRDIDRGELDSFYQTLEKIYNNLEEITKDM